MNPSRLLKKPRVFKNPNLPDDRILSEQLRVGLRTRLEPGKAAPLTVSWRQQGERAVLVDYGAGALPVPAG